MWFEKRIRKTARLMRENDVEEVSVSRFFGLIKIAVRRAKIAEIASEIKPAAKTREEPLSWKNPSVSEPNLSPKPGEEVVKAPSVGVYYFCQPNEENSKPVVTEGMRISFGQILGWIVALNITKALTSEKTGTIKKVLVTNEMPVDYGKPLFIIVPD